MAVTSLNAFLNNTAILSTTDTILYTTPTAKSTVVLNCQVANINTASSVNTSFYISKNGTSNTDLVTNFAVPPNDAANILTGKLVLMANDSIVGSASVDNQLKVVISILESQL